MIASSSLLSTTPLRPLWLAVARSITHAVVDVERWLKGKAERAAAIGAAGTNVTDYVAADGSNNIAVTADIHDLDATQALMASPPPEMAAQMETHGVIPPFTTYIEAP